MTKKKSVFAEMAEAKAANTVSPTFPKEVTIREADNGLVLTFYGPNGSKTKIAKDWDEALACCKDYSDAKKKD